MQTIEYHEIFKCQHSNPQQQDNEFGTMKRSFDN